MDTLTFIKNYEEILRKRGIAKGTFYSECKISDAAVSQWRKGKTSPSPYTIERISEYLGVSGDDLFAAKKEKPVPNEDALDKMLISLLKELTPEETAKAVSFVQGLLAGREA